MTIAGLVNELKTDSSKWLKAQTDELRNFSWQHGYGVFSVGPQDEGALIEYIENQEEHHRTKTFQEEYMLFLKKYKTAYDKRYLWD